MYGQKIKTLRKAAKLNQADLAEMTGVSRPNVSFWEKAEFPPLEAVAKICNALEIDLSDFFDLGTGTINKNGIPQSYVPLLQTIAKLPDEIQKEILKITTQITESFSHLAIEKKMILIPAEHDIDSFTPTAYGRTAGYHAMELYFSRFMWLSTSLN